MSSYLYAHVQEGVLFNVLVCDFLMSRGALFRDI